MHKLGPFSTWRTGIWPKRTSLLRHPKRINIDDRLEESRNATTTGSDGESLNFSISEIFPFLLKNCQIFYSLFYNKFTFHFNFISNKHVI